MSRPVTCGIAGLFAALVFVALLLINSRHSIPLAPGEFTFELTFSAAVDGRTEPILVTGMYGEGDLLLVRYRSDSSAVFVYDPWGGPDTTSEPFSFTPGTRYRLRVAMPSLTTYHKPSAEERGKVRVDLDGRPLLYHEVRYHGRLPKQLFFGQNPIGGSAEKEFRGALVTLDGRRPSGGPETYFTRIERLRVWLGTHPWHVPGFVLLGLGSGLGMGWVIRSGWLLAALGACWRVTRRTARDLDLGIVASDDPPADAVRRRRSLGWFAALTLFATVGYAWVVTGGSFTFNHAEVFGNFYDYQAASFLQGRLDVPEEAIGNEAFEARGKLYGYFGPTPALLRLPFVAAGLAFGKLSRAFMVLYFVGCLIAAWLLLREALRLVAPGSSSRAASPLPSPFASCILIGSTGFGSTILFLGSRGLVFHEAILAGILFALWSGWCALRYLRVGGRWWGGALIFGLLAVHSRPPAGLFALGLLGCVALFRLALGWWRHRSLAAMRTPILVAAFCALGFLTLNGLAWLKFRTFDPAPLRISRPYANPARLQHIDGKSFHLVNIPYNFDTYFLFPNFRFIAIFPWFYLVTDQPRREFPRAKIDLPDHTLALPYAMPSLFALATLGSLGAAIGRLGTRAALAAIWLAALPVIFAMLTAVATAQRYTGDFVPWLVATAAFGLAAVESVPPRRRAVLRGIVLLLTCMAIAVNLALTLHYQGEILWGVPEEIRENYQRLRHAIGGWLARWM